MDSAEEIDKLKEYISELENRLEEKNRLLDQYIAEREAEKAKSPKQRIAEAERAAVTAISEHVSEAMMRGRLEKIRDDNPELYDSAKQGDVGAIKEYALLLKDDKTEAAIWYMRAALKGDLECQMHLAYLFRKGIGVPCNKVKALSWYNIAIENGGAYEAESKRGSVCAEIRRENEYPSDPSAESKPISKPIERANELSKQLIEENPEMIQKKD